MLWPVPLAYLLFLFLLVPHSRADVGDVVLADFEKTIPCSEMKDPVGFRKMDCARGSIVPDGAEGSAASAVFRIAVSEESSPVKNDLFLQGRVRRMYLATQNAVYDSKGPNALSFWLKLGPDSMLIKGEKKATFGVWTYHWEPGDQKVGGNSNQGLATDSMMHGYANFKFKPAVADGWVHVVLTPSAFKQSRYYYHFFAARGTTGYLKFFPSLRQIQFHFFGKIRKEQHLQIDEIKLVYREPVALFEDDFYSAATAVSAGDVTVPVVISNPTGRDRKYRVFISSVIGVDRKALYEAHTKTDGFEAPRTLQRLAGGDGGLGAAELLDSEGTSVIREEREITISAGQSWRGLLVHHVNPRMVGKKRGVTIGEHKLYAQRNTLTTSVIVWDPYDSLSGEMSHLDGLQSNADDGRHRPPPGFPPQSRPPKGWRSEDVPVDQVGAYFVSVLRLKEGQ